MEVKPLNLVEPKIHSHIEDMLPDDHHLACEDVECKGCGDMVHAFNNECMETWVETGLGNFCLGCFIKLVTEQDAFKVLRDEFGLEEEV